VDIDGYIARNQPSWIRLAELTRRARKRVGQLSPAELDELLGLYQRTSAQLSYARPAFGDNALTARLTRLVADASGVIYGTRPRVWQTVRTFFVVTYPGAVWDSRRFVMIGVALTFVPAIVFGAWLVGDARALNATGTAQQRHQYVHDEFEQYYSDQPHVEFFTRVTTNNILVSFEAFAGGAALGVFGIIALLTNGLNLGQAGAWMITDGSGWRFLGLILPHGLLELSAICIAGGTGLRLGWTIVAPGDRSRSDALAEQGRRMIVIVIGLATMFLCAGTIEGFITGSNLPAGVKVAIGFTAWLAYVAYLVVFGRRAAAQGFVGDLDEVSRAVDQRAADLIEA
jgi:uncharacterized membrane protein SpoIIM required for sporulation